MIHSPWMHALIFSLLSLALTEGSGKVARAAPSGDPVEQFTPVLFSVVFPPEPVKTTDGRYHLVYELGLVNTSTGSARVDRVEVHDSSSGLILASLPEAEIAQSLKALGALGPSATLASGQAGLVWLDVSFARPEDIPVSLEQQVTATLQQPDLGAASQPVTANGAALKIAAQAQPLVIGPPLQGPGWVSSNGCCGLSDHRRSVIPIDDKLSLPERFAIDWIQLDPENRVFRGDPGKVESYPTFGQPTLAVLDATVVEAVDEFPDQVPYQSTPASSLSELSGNHVILDLGGGRFALYAHLKQGSVRARSGERVKRGDVLGRVGNSGNTEAPHLHFQITNGPGDGTQGIPYVIDSFQLVGRAESESADLAVSEGTPVRIQSAEAGPRREELPMDSDVIGFP